MDVSVSQEGHYYSETKDDRTPTGSSVVVENMRARLSFSNFDTVRCSPNYTYAKEHSRGARGHPGLVQVLYG